MSAFERYGLVPHLLDSLRREQPEGHEKIADIAIATPRGCVNR